MQYEVAGRDKLLFMEQVFKKTKQNKTKTHTTVFSKSAHICDQTPANEALCGKINFEFWAKMQSKVKISQK